MKITSIYMKNFLCYSGENNFIEFKDGLNLVIGGNGYGKTKLYDAFNWVFLDGITGPKGNLAMTKDVKDRLISQKAIDNTNEGYIECEVAVEVKKNDKLFKLKRKYSIQKNENGKILPNNESFISIFEKSETEYKPLDIKEKDSFNSFIENNLISLDKLAHLWFQGERGISKAIDTTNIKEFEAIIRNLSYIEHWQKYSSVADNAFERINRSYRKEVNSASKGKSKREKLNLEIQDLKRGLLKTEEELSEAQDELERIRTRLEANNEDIKAYPSIKDFQARKADLERELSECQYRLKELLEDSDRSLFNKNWLVLDTDYLTNAFETLHQNYIYEKHSQSKLLNESLPPIPLGNPSPVHIKEMLEKEQCYICGRPAKKGSAHYENIKKLLPKNYPSIEEKLNNYFHVEGVDKLSKNIIRVDTYKEDFEFNAQEEQKAYYSLLEETEQFIQDKKSLDNEEILMLNALGVESVESIIYKVQQNDNLTDDLNECSQRIGNLQNIIANTQKEIDEKEKQIDKLVGGEVDPNLSKYRDYFKDLINAVKYGRNSEYDRLVSLLETQANSHYENINRASGAYEGMIKFKKNANQGYSSKIFNTNGENVTENMNTSQILSMQFSILMAILSTNKNKGLARDYPLIADAPNASFDYKKRQALLKEIAKTFNQAIIMMFEFLEDDPSRLNRYKVDEKSIAELKSDFRDSNISINVIHLDIPDGLNVKNLGELEINLRQI